MGSFPLYVHKVLEELAIEYNIKLKKETHYEAIDRELQWFKNNELHRLNFNFNNNESSITVTYLIDKFPIFPKILIWCHNFIPLFPYYAKTTWNKLIDLPLGLSKDEYRDRARKILISINK